LHITLLANKPDMAEVQYLMGKLQSTVEYISISISSSDIEYYNLFFLIEILRISINRYRT